MAADGVKIAGDVDLRAASITGETSLIGARVNGDVKLDGGTFELPGAIAMTLNRAVIDGALFLRGGVTIDGALSLNGTQVGTIVDEPASWPKAGDLLLNRFRYGGFVGSPVDARRRLDWLSRQAPERWGEDFWPSDTNSSASFWTRWAIVTTPAKSCSRRSDCNGGCGGCGPVGLDALSFG